MNFPKLRKVTSFKLVSLRLGLKQSMFRLFLFLFDHIANIEKCYLLDLVEISIN